MLVVPILSQAVPAELMLALRALHIGATTCLVDEHTALWTRLSDDQLSQLVGALSPLCRNDDTCLRKRHPTVLWLKRVSPLVVALLAFERLCAVDSVCFRIDDSEARIVAVLVWAAPYIICVDHVMFESEFGKLVDLSAHNYLMLII